MRSVVGADGVGDVVIITVRRLDTDAVGLGLGCVSSISREPGRRDRERKSDIYSRFHGVRTICQEADSGMHRSLNVGRLT